MNSAPVHWERRRFYLEMERYHYHTYFVYIRSSACVHRSRTVYVYLRIHFFILVICACMHRKNDIIVWWKTEWNVNSALKHILLLVNYTYIYIFCVCVCVFARSRAYVYVCIYIFVPIEIIYATTVIIINWMRDAYGWSQYLVIVDFLSTIRNFCS